MNKYMYVGCRTTKERNAKGKGISVYQIEENTYKLKKIFPNLVNPSYLCFDETKKFLYTVHGDFSEISSFFIKEDGTLSHINTTSTGGKNPVHLSVDKSNSWMFVANLETGTVAVIPLNPDGSLGELKELYKIAGLSEETHSHPHQVIQDKTRNFLLVSCQGRKQGFGQICIFQINSDNGTLELKHTVKSREIAEPRHMAFHPNNKFCYGVNEKDYTVTFYNFNEKNGELIAKQIIPTLPDTYVEDGWASGITIDKTGKYIVVSNRKSNSITSFEINQETGRLSFKDCISTGGIQPRYITISDKNIVWVANELSDSIKAFSINEKGKFKIKNINIESETPTCIIFS